MNELISTIAGFLEIDEPGLDDFSVYTTGDLDFLEKIAKDRRFSAREISEIRRQVKSNESYFIPRANIIYLADLSTPRAAEEAAHFINTICGGFHSGGRDARDAFYYRAVKEAIGFFGSRIIDHKRYCMSFQDFRGFLAVNRGRRLDHDGAFIRKIARLALKHRDAEVRAIGKKRPLGRAGLVYGQPPAIVNGVAHALGYILGDKLYNALVTGIVTKRYVRQLFYDRLLPGRSEERYLELVERLADVDHGVPADGERF
jgi:hypothetical protein